MPLIPTTYYDHRIHQILPVCLTTVNNSSASASIPCIDVPRRFDGATLSNLADAVVAACPEGWPPELILDLEKLDFIQPAGVIFLSNLVWWLDQHGTTVHFVNADQNVAAHRYLDNSRFFEQHTGSKIWKLSAPRSTTIPLQQIAPSHSHDWLEHTLLPWLAKSVGLTQASFYDLKTCLSELFNNIREHTQLEIGSIFVQHYPNQRRINISLADFGLGIPREGSSGEARFRGHRSGNPGRPGGLHNKIHSRKRRFGA